MPKICTADIGKPCQLISIEAGFTLGPGEKIKEMTKALYKLTCDGSEIGRVLTGEEGPWAELEFFSTVALPGKYELSADLISGPKRFDGRINFGEQVAIVD